MLKILKKIQEQAKEILFPAFCLGCGKEGSLLCPECFKKLPIHSSISCFYCGKRLPQDIKICARCRNKHRPSIENIFIASEWEEELIKKAIYDLKYLFISDYSAVLSQIMADFIQKTAINALFEQNSAIIPVPLHPKRLSWRGFNQAEEIAKIVGSKFNIPVLNIIERVRYTAPQAEIKEKSERRRNISSAFRLNKKALLGLPEPIKEKNVLIIDDVSTTGYTLNECARAIKPFGFKSVYGLVIARG